MSEPVVLCAIDVRGVATVTLNRPALNNAYNAEFLHAPYVDLNVQILELTESGDFARAAATLTDYLVQSERIVLAVYARHMSDVGWAR